MDFLQSIVMPVVTYRIEGDTVKIRRCFGTSFQISSHGYGLSASHVLRNAFGSLAHGEWVGVVGKGADGREMKSTICPIQQWQPAPAPYDVAVLQTEYKSATRFRLAPKPVEPWKDVASYGYPENAIVDDRGSPLMHLRCFKGYVHRCFEGDRKRSTYEVSFRIGSGQSGSPLFIYGGDTDPVIGVCIGTTRSEIILDTRVEVRDDNTEYRETTSKVEEFGIAHDLTSLADWQPDGIDGRTLRELFASE